MSDRISFESMYNDGFSDGYSEALKDMKDAKQSPETGQVDAIVNYLWVPIMWINDNPVIDSAKYFNTKEEALEFIDSHKIKASNVVQWTIPRIEKGN